MINHSGYTMQATVNGSSIADIERINENDIHLDRQYHIGEEEIGRLHLNILVTANRCSGPFPWRKWTCSSIHCGRNSSYIRSILMAQYCGFKRIGKNPAAALHSACCGPVSDSFSCLCREIIRQNKHGFITFAAPWRGSSAG